MRCNEIFSEVNINTLTYWLDYPARANVVKLMTNIVNHLEFVADFLSS